jgi:hypothetical protein
MFEEFDAVLMPRNHLAWEFLSYSRCYLHTPIVFLPVSVVGKYIALLGESQCPWQNVKSNTYIWQLKTKTPKADRIYPNLYIK